jgi:hypothetical protein
VKRTSFVAFISLVACGSPPTPTPDGGEVSVDPAAKVRVRIGRLK